MNSNDISGLLPQFVVAKTVGGNWCAYTLTPTGYVRLTLSRYSPADAADALAQELRAMERAELDKFAQTGEVR